MVQMLSRFAHAPWLTVGSGAVTVLGGTMYRELIRGIFAAALVLLASGVASAQFSTIGDSPPRFEWRGRVSADYRSEFETKSDAGDEFHAWRTGIAGEFGGPINESILVSFGTRYAHSSYDFNLDFGSPPVYGTTSLPRDPWNSLNTIDFLPSTTILVGEKVAVVLALPIRYAGESGTDRNGFAAGVSALVRWQISDKVSVGVGLGVTSQLEKEAETFPIVALKWRITEGLTLMTEGDWFQGGRTTLLWGTSNSIRFTISAGYERTRFRLDDNGTTADTNGIGEITTIPVEVGVRIRLMESAFLDVKTGLGIAGRIRVESDNGRKLYDQQFDPAPRVGIAITFPFGLPAR
jgi:hypothetical protein